MSDDDKPSAAGQEGLETFDVLLRDIARSEPREPPSKDDLAGKPLGHYRILAELGHGGMGIVYRAEDTRLGRDVALKVLPASFAGEEERRRRFLREARAAAAINHPNIATVYEVGEVDGRLFLAMERVEGNTLRVRLNGGPLGQAEALRIARQIALGLARAHEKGIVHRDLKPENVMLTRDGDVKLLDFGIAKLKDPVSADGAPPSQTTLTQDGRVMGTPGYMSPEQATGKSVDQRTDVYALGVVLHEMLMGELPALGSGRLAENSAVAAVVTRCLARAPEERWASATEVLGALDALGAKGGGTGRRWGPRKLAMVVIVGGALLAGAVLVGVASKGRRAPASLVSVSPGTSASAKPRAIGLLDGPPPATKSPEALAAYQRAMTDRRDAGRRPAISLRRAVELDPEFAAAHLRLTFDLRQPASTRAYGEAVRYRANLDARDLEILHAEEPLETTNPADVAEAVRRYTALRAARPLDVEILMRLSDVQGWKDPIAAQASYRELLALDPTAPASEYGAGMAAEGADDLSGALAHYKRCLELSATAGKCLQAIAKMSAMSHDCDEYVAQLGRVLVIEPDDPYVRFNMFNAILGDGRGYDEARTALDMERNVMTSMPADIQKWWTAEDEGELGLWFGSFRTARAAFEQVEATEAPQGMSKSLSQQRLGIAEETRDEAEAVSLLRTAVSSRATNPVADPHDDVLLDGLRRHGVFPPQEIAALRDHWREEARSSGAGEWSIWLVYDASPSQTAAEAREALAHGKEAAAPRRPSAHVSAQLGRLLLLAGRPADAAAHLESAAYECRPIVGDLDSETILIVRAALDLGRAREALGDTKGACVAYQRVLGRWGHATPRSVTADAAREAAKRLHCAE